MIVKIRYGRNWYCIFTGSYFEVFQNSHGDYITTNNYEVNGLQQASFINKDDAEIVQTTRVRIVLSAMHQWEWHNDLIGEEFTVDTSSNDYRYTIIGGMYAGNTLPKYILEDVSNPIYRNNCKRDNKYNLDDIVISITGNVGKIVSFTVSLNKDKIYVVYQVDMGWYTISVPEEKIQKRIETIGELWEYMMKASHDKMSKKYGWGDC